jgi:hypothetical protein
MLLAALRAMTVHRRQQRPGDLELDATAQATAVDRGHVRLVPCEAVTKALVPPTYLLQPRAIARLLELCDLRHVRRGNCKAKSRSAVRAGFTHDLAAVRFDDVARDRARNKRSPPGSNITTPQSTVGYHMEPDQVWFPCQTQSVRQVTVVPKMPESHSDMLCSPCCENCCRRDHTAVNGRMECHGGPSPGPKRRAQMSVLIYVNEIPEFAT